MFAAGTRIALTKAFQVEKLFDDSIMVTVLPSHTRGTVTDDKPDRFDHSHDACTPIQFDIAGSRVIWTWNFVLRLLDPLENLSEI